MNVRTLTLLQAQAARLRASDNLLQRQLHEPEVWPARRAWTRAIARAVLALFTAQTLLAAGPAWAQVTAAPTAISGQKPLIDAAANGVPIVHIAPPSRAGVSRNQYQEFNVQPEGLILNNSTGSVQTQQGGWISGNLQLGPTPARIILNEVVGTNASQLRGTIEVAGARADIVIANPNGITCDGCGFLNTAGRTSLVAGQPRFGEGGSLDGFQTGQGSIHVGPGGLNAAEQDQLDLIARGLVIEGEVWARNLNVIAGANHVLYGTLVATAQPAGTAGAAPLFAVDIKQLGGMYANQVYLMATEQGLGVNSSGRVAALQGNLVLSGQGDLSLNDSYAKGDVQLNAQGKVTLSGQTLSEANMSVTAGSGLSNQGATQAGGQLAITAPSLANSGLLVQRASTDFIIETPAGFENSGTVYGAGNVRVGTASLTGTGGRLLAGGHLEVAAQTVAVSEQTLAADGNVRIAASQLRASQSTLQSGGSLALDSSGRLDVAGSAMLANGGATLSGQDISADGTRLSALGDVSLHTAGALSLQRAEITGNTSVALQGSVVHAQGARLSAQQGLTLQSSGDINLSDSEALAGQQLSLRGQGVHTAGAVVAAPKLVVEAAGGLDNGSGRLLATSGEADALRVAARGVNNTGGEIRANGGVALDAGNGALNNTQGLIAGQSGTITGLGGLVNSRGVIYTTSDLNLSSPGLDNSQGVIASAGSLGVTTAGQAIVNSGGTLQAGGNLTLDSTGGAIDSAAGKLIAGGAISARGGLVTLSTATVAAGRDASVAADTLNASASTVAVDGALQLSASGSVDLSNATVSAATGLVAGAANLQGGGAQVASGGQLQVVTGGLVGGNWSAVGDANISATARVDLSGGGLAAGAGVSVQAQGISTDAARVGGNNVTLNAGNGAYTNIGGVVVAQGTGATALQVLGRGIDNSGGVLASAGGAVLDARGQTLDNTGGTVQVVGTLQISGGQLLNRSGTLATGSSISIQGQAVDNTGGTLQTSGQLTIDTGGRLLDNTGGRLLAQGDASIAASELRNSGGTIAANGGTSVRADSLDTSSGRITGTRALDVVVAQHLTGNTAVLATEGTLQISAASAELAGSIAQAGQSLTLSAAGTLDLAGATLSAVGPLNVQAQDALRLDGGLLLTDSDLQVRATSLAATGLRAQTLGRLDLGATSGSATVDGAVLIAGQTLNLQGQGISARSADLAAVGNASLQAGTGALDAADLRVRSESGDIAVAGSRLAAAASIAPAAGADPTRGFIAAGNLDIASGGGVDLSNAAAVAGADVRLQAAGALSTRGGLLAAGGSATLSGTELDNQGGRIEGANALAITVTQGTVNNNAGSIATQGPLTLQGQAGAALVSLSNQSGSIQTAGSLDLQVGSLDNRGGTVLALGSLAVRGGPIDTSDGVLAARGDLQLDAQGGSFQGARSRLLSEQGNLSLAGGAIQLDGALVAARGSATLSGSEASGVGAIISARDSALSIAVGSGSAAFDNAQLLAGGALTLQAGATSLNAGRVASGADITLATGALQARGASIDAQGALTVTASGAVDASGARLAASQAASVTATQGVSVAAGQLSGRTVVVDAGNGSIDNTLGTIVASGSGAQALRLSSQGLVNAGGQVHSGGELVVNAQAGAVDNSAGMLTAVEAATVRGTGLNNRAGTLAANGTLAIEAGVANAQALVANAGGSIRSAQGSLTLSGGELRNAAETGLSAGFVGAAQDLTLTMAAGIDNTGARISAGRDVSLQAGGALRNDLGTLVAGRNLSVAASEVSNVEGVIAGNGALSITARSGGMDNTRGQLVAGGAVGVSATGNIANQQGRINAGGALALGGAVLDNRQGQITAAGGNASLAVSGLNGAGGVIAASGNLNLAAGSGAVDATAGLLSSGGSMTLSGGATTMTSAQLVSGSTLALTGTSLQATGADIQAAGPLTLNTGSGSLNVAGATLLSAQTAGLSGGAISLRGSRLEANTSVTATGSSIDATDGRIQSAGDVRLNATGTLDFAGAQMLAGQDLEARGTVAGTSTGAQMLAGRDLSIGTGSAIDFNSFAHQFSRDLTVRAQGISTAGKELVGRNLILDAGAGLFDNSAGTLLATGSLSLSSQGLSNQGGEVAANGTVNVQAGSGAVDNRTGAVYSTQADATLAGGSVDNRGGTISSATSTSVQAGTGSVLNAAGVISGLNSVAISGALNNDAGVVEAGTGGISINTGGGQLVNTNSGSTRGIVSSGNIGIAAGAIDNQAGYIGASGSLTISQSSAIDNRGGVLTGVGSASVASSGGVDNRAGSITSAGDVSLTAASLNNSGASAVFAGRNLTVNAGSIDNSGTHDGSWRLGLLAGGNLSITAGTINNASGAIVALGDATVRASSSLNNSGGRIAGRTVTVEAPSFTNTAGRIDAQERLTARVPQFSADGVLASSGSLELQTTGDYTNGGTVAATNDLVVSTTGRYINNGTVSAQRNLTLSASNLDNNTGAQIVSQSTTLNITGTVNNAGLINSSSGATTINAVTVNNTGRIYGDSVVLNANVGNSGGAAIASRAGDITVRGSLSNGSLSDVVSLRDLSVQGNLTNQNATIDVSRNVSVSGALSNLNAGFGVGTTTTTESISQLYVRPKDSSTRYPAGELGWSNASPGYYVLPSTTYPIAQFGADAKLTSTSLVCEGGGEGGGCTYQNNYTSSDPIWQLFGVAAPIPPSVTPDASGCFITVGETGSTERSYAGVCGEYWSQVDAYSATASTAYAQLDAKIYAFNLDLQSRTLVDWYETQITYREVNKPVVTYSQPGLIRAGGSVSGGAGSVNQDSAIVAGGGVSGSISNIASEAQQTATEYGQERLVWREWHGGWSSSYSRNYEAWQVTSGGTVTETVKLDTLTAPSRATATITNTLAGAGPAALSPSLGSIAPGVRGVSLVAAPQIAAGISQGVQVGSVGTAGPSQVQSGGVVQTIATGAISAGLGVAPTVPAIATAGTVLLDAAVDAPLPGSVIAAGVRAGQAQAIEAVRTSFATQVAARPLPVLAANTIGVRQPAPPVVKAVGYRTATSSGRLEAPASQLFRINTAPDARYLVETDPAFTNYREWLSSDWMLSQLSMDPERNLKRYGDGFAEQRLVDDQIFALTGQRFLSGYSSTEAEYQDLLNAGVLYAREYQLTPGVALTAEQMAVLTTDIVWLETQQVYLPDGSSTQALVPKVYLRRLTDGDLTRPGAIISASSIDLRNPGGDLVNSGTLFAHGGVQGGAGSLSLQAANIRNTGTLAGNQIAVQAAGDISQVGGEAIGLGAGSAIGYGAGGNIILQTTTQSGNQSLLGAKGTTQVSRTNVDRVASIAADSVTLAALGNIDFTGAKVNATNSLNVAAGGTISASAVRDTYTIDIPLGGSLRGKTGNVQIASVTNVGSELSAGTNLNLNAGSVVTLVGSTVSATGTVAISGQSVTIEAAKDLESLDQTAVKRKGYTRFAESNETLSGGIVAAGGSLVIAAQDDITAKGAVISSSDGLAALVAGGNVNIENVLTEHSSANESYSKSSSVVSKKSKLTESAEQASQVEGSLVQGNSVLVSAGNNLNVTGSTVTAAGNATLAAGNDVVIQSAAQVAAGTFFHEEKKSGFTASIEGVGYGKSSQNQSERFQTTTQVGSLVAGENVAIAAGRDAIVAASAAVADRDLVVTAGRNVELQTRDDILQSQTEAHSKSTHIGLSPTGLSPRFTQFSQTKTNQDGQTQAHTAVESLLSGNEGSVTLTAGTDGQHKGTGQGNVTTQGGTMLAADTVSLTGNQVQLGTADSASTSRFHMDTKSVTLGAQLAGTVGSQITRTYDAVVESTKTDNDRLAGALVLKGAYDAAKLSSNFGGEAANVNAATNAANKTAGDPNTSPFAVSVTLGTSKSSFDSKQGATSQHGTVIQANDIQINATEGDLSATGAKLQASGDASLRAAGAINLTAAQNTSEIEQHNKSSSASIGATFGIGGQQNGISFQAGASKSQGYAEGKETTWDNTLVTAGGTLNLQSGGDTSLVGAQLVGSTVKADIGGQLNIQSLQDTSDFKSEQKSSGWGVSLCIPPFCYGTSSVSVNAAQQSIDHSYQSATGQSGIAAGEGGFQIGVGGTTNLTGGAITSQAEQDKNTLTTAGITYTDLTNTQNTSASSSSLSLSTSASPVANATSNLLGNLAGQTGLPKSGSESATTLSVISPANVTITGTGDAKADQQSLDNVATLTTRDASTANGSLVNTLTLDQAQQLQAQIRKAQEDARAAQLIGAVLDETIGDIAKKNEWEEGSMEKTILHGLSGAIQAGIAGGNVVAGAAAGALNEQLIPVMKDYLVANGIKEGTREFNEYMALGSTLAGAAVGAAAGGTQGAAIGGSVAHTGTVNNFLKHHEAAAMNKKLNDCKAKPGGCSMAESDKIFNEYRALSDANIRQVQACIFLGDTACVNDLLAHAAKPGEVTNTALSSQQQAVLYGRQTNAAYYLSVTGSKVPGTTDAQQALKVAQFRQSNCTQPDSAACDAVVWKAMANDQKTALALFGASLGVAPAAAVVAAAPAAAAATTTAIRACAANAIYCANRVAIVGTDVVLGDALGGASLVVPAAAAGKVVSNIGAAAADAAGTVRSGTLLSLTNVEGPTTILVRPALTNTFRNDGVLGEQVAAQLMHDMTGLTFKPIQNGSGNGIDLIGVDVANRTIWAPEVKSSMVGSFPNPESLDLSRRTKDWIASAASGNIAGQALSPGDVAYARQMQAYLAAGYDLKPLAVQVSIPRTGVTGSATAVLIPIK